MEYLFEQHCTDDDLELYALGRLNDDGSELVEEHLLICGTCQTRLDEADQYVRAMRNATFRLRAEQPKPIFAKFSEWFRVPAVPMWAGAAACLLLIVFSATWIGRQNGGGSPVPVSLLAERGGGNTVPANRPLRVSLDARGLELGPKAHLVLVDANGVAVESADAPVESDHIQVRLPKPLHRGNFYLRVFKGQDEDPVREFLLEVQ